MFEPDAIEAAIQRIGRRMVAISHGDTSTTMLQPLAEIGALCRKHDVLLYVDCTASLGGNPFEMDAWQIDVASAGLQKCLSGPPGSSPVSFNDRVAAVVNGAQAHRAGHQDAGHRRGRRPGHPLELFRPRHADGLLVARSGSTITPRPPRMLYAARECARVVLGEGLERGIARHRLASGALRAGLEAMGLELFGDAEAPHGQRDGRRSFRRRSPTAKRCAREMLQDFGIEIGTSFGPLAGKIWRIGTMGYVCRKANVLRCLDADHDGFSEAR